MGTGFLLALVSRTGAPSASKPGSEAAAAAAASEAQSILSKVRQAQRRRQQEQKGRGAGEGVPHDVHRMKCAADC